MKNIDKEPYAYFFPIGLLLSLIGVGVWIPFWFKWTNYPGLIHPDLMMGGAILLFVCGFLMTAGPKFTASYAATDLEVRIGWGLMVLLVVTSVWDDLSFRLMSLTVLIYLWIFLINRWRHRRNNPPEPFILIPMGLFIATISQIIIMLNPYYMIPQYLYQVSRLFAYQGFISLLIFGVGSRLGLMLLGRGGFVQFPFKYWGIGFILTFFVEAQFTFWGMILRFILVSYLLFKAWRLHEKPGNNTKQSFWLWMSMWSLWLGLFGSLWVEYRIHFMHIYYISGVGLITFMIATRVSLAHGGYGFSLEKDSKAITWMGWLFVVGALTRLSAGFMPKVYESHLAYASMCWIVGVVIWGWVFLPKMLKLGGPSQC